MIYDTAKLNNLIDVLKNSVLSENTTLRFALTKAWQAGFEAGLNHGNNNHQPEVKT